MYEIANEITQVLSYYNVHIFSGVALVTWLMTKNIIKSQAKMNARISRLETSMFGEEVCKKNQLK